MRYAILVIPPPPMARYKPAKQKKTETQPQVKAGVPCLVLVILAIGLTMFLLYEVMKNAS